MKANRCLRYSSPLICMKRGGGVHGVRLLPRLKASGLQCLVIRTQGVNIHRKESFSTKKSSFALSKHSYLLTNGVLS